MNNYFVMTLDNRALKDKKIQLEDRRFLKEEPFVSYLNFDKGEKLPDFIQGKCENQTFFCISQAMKDIFDAYVSFQKEIPVFFTDSQFRNQNVYWIIDLIEKDCLIQDFYADRFHLTFSYSPEDGQYLWKTKNIRTVYVIVSLELAENLLRRQMYGLCFSPVLNRT